jgi:hypothetical protein
VAEGPGSARGARSGGILRRRWGVRVGACVRACMYVPACLHVCVCECVREAHRRHSS